MVVTSIYACSTYLCHCSTNKQKAPLGNLYPSEATLLFLLHAVVQQLFSYEHLILTKSIIQFFS